MNIQTVLREKGFITENEIYIYTTNHEHGVRSPKGTTAFEMGSIELQICKHLHENGKFPFLDIMRFDKKNGWGWYFGVNDFLEVTCQTTHAIGILQQLERVEKKKGCKIGFQGLPIPFSPSIPYKLSKSESYICFSGNKLSKIQMPFAFTEKGEWIEDFRSALISFIIGNL